MATKAEIRKALSNPKGESITGPRLAGVDIREFSRLTGIVNYFAIVLALSFTSRLILDSLIFLSDGKGDRFFAVNDWRLAYLIRSEQRLLKDKTLSLLKDADGQFVILGGKKISEAGLCKWISRNRKTLIAEMDKARVTLVEIKSGGHRKGENLPHEYRLPMISMIQEVQDQLADSLSLDSDNQEVIEKEIFHAVKAVLEAERKAVKRSAIVQRFRRPRETPEKYLKLSAAYYRKSLDLCRDNEQFQQIGFEAEELFSQAFIERAKMKGLL